MCAQWLGQRIDVLLILLNKLIQLIIPLLGAHQHLHLMIHMSANINLFK